MAVHYETPQGFQIPAKGSDGKRILKPSTGIDLVTTRIARKMGTLAPGASDSIEQIRTESNPDID